MTAILEARELTKRFGGIVAVADVSLSLARGALHAVIGPNGAGKSTLVGLLAGELPPSAGGIFLDGRDITGLPDWRRARAGLGRTFQRSNVVRDLPALENARLAAQAATVRGFGLLRAPSAARAVSDAARGALDRVGLLGEAERPAGTLGHGRLRLLEIAMALAGDPRALLLDEPLAGLGAEEIRPVADLIRSLATDRAVLLIEHDMDVVFSRADRITVMVEGRVLTEGTPAEIKTSPQVRDAYLGRPTDGDDS